MNQIASGPFNPEAVSKALSGLLPDEVRQKLMLGALNQQIELLAMRIYERAAAGLVSERNPTPETLKELAQASRSAARAYFEGMAGFPADSP